MNYAVYDEGCMTTYVSGYAFYGERVFYNKYRSDVRPSELPMRLWRLSNIYDMDIYV